jgi:hypothetical protein
MQLRLIMSKLIRFSLLSVLLFAPVCVHTQDTSPAVNDFYGLAVRKGADRMQRFYYNTAFNPGPDSRKLGSNTAGYNLGRFGIHSLLWTHLTWERSPEYDFSPKRMQFLADISNKIDTITKSPYYLDVSQCGRLGYVGPKMDALDAFEDGFLGWGFRKSFDAMTPLPSSVGNMIKGAWYKIKIRVENSSSVSNSTISVWMTPASGSFDATPDYRQTYDGRERNQNQEDSIISVLDGSTPPARSGSEMVLWPYCPLFQILKYAISPSMKAAVD